MAKTIFTHHVVFHKPVSVQQAADFAIFQNRKAEQIRCLQEAIKDGYGSLIGGGRSDITDDFIDSAYEFTV